MLKNSQKWSSFYLLTLDLLDLDVNMNELNQDIPFPSGLTKSHNSLRLVCVLFLLLHPTPTSSSRTHPVIGALNSMIRVLPWECVCMEEITAALLSLSSYSRLLSFATRPLAELFAGSDHWAGGLSRFAFLSSPFSCLEIMSKSHQEIRGLVPLAGGMSGPYRNKMIDRCGES
jgi:hypothetical protein